MVEDSGEKTTPGGKLVNRKQIREQSQKVDRVYGDFESALADWRKTKNELLNKLRQKKTDKDLDKLRGELEDV